MSSKTILLIDDEADIREVVQMSLELSDFGREWKAIAAASGNEGLELARQHQPDAILLDVMMPDIDGPTTLKKLKADPTTQSIPVIFLTAKLRAKDPHRYKELGVVTVLEKPFDPLSLADEIAKALAWKS